MRTALFADIHANLGALEACLGHARERGAERYAFLGDLVGYGPDPAAVVEVVAAMDGAIVVKGNHDDAIEVEPKTHELGDVAYDVIVWSRSVLSADQRRFLATLPLIVRERDLCFVHSSADRPENWEYVDDASAAQRSMAQAGTAYVFCGHVHEPMLYFKTRGGKIASFQPSSGSPVPVARHHGWLSIVGSVGQPRDGNPAAAYAMFDDASETLTLFRVPYDHLATAQRLRAMRLGVSELLAERIERAY
jgi:diadenosine tetraphosphatase ApaH/serine/threonine PP2A family protein phosphatase